MDISIYDYSDYKAYLSDALKHRARRGERSRLAEAIHCHTAYVSQVLNGNAHFSLEQGSGISEFLRLDQDEMHFFLLLIQLAKAGTAALKSYFLSQLDEIHAKRMELKNRIKANRVLSVEERSIYYSSWHYAAIHMLVSIPEYATREKIAERLDLPLQKVSEGLQFLVTADLVREEQNRFEIGATRLHLGRESRMIVRHHTNWRLQAIASLDSEASDDLHFSSVVTIARADVPKVRSILVKAIDDIRGVIGPSKDEEVYCYLMDLFPVRKRGR